MTTANQEQNFIEVKTSEAGFASGKYGSVIDFQNGTVYETLWRHSVETYPENECLGYRVKTSVELSPTGKKIQKYSEYKWITYAECGNIVDNVGAGIANLFDVQPLENIGIFMGNRPEWLLADFAIHRQGGVSVPLYSTFGPEAIAYIVNHAELRVIFCEAHLAPALLQTLNSVKTLKAIVLVGELSLTDEQKETLETHGVALTAWDDVAVNGSKATRPAVQCKNGDIYSIVYTSGTTGRPKGAMLTNRNVLTASEIIVASGHFPNGVYNEVHFSYLPLSHVYERDVVMEMIRFGAKIGFISGSLSGLLSDLHELKPTFFIGVPRVFTRIYDKVNEKVAQMGFFQRTAFNVALHSKLNARQNGTTTWVDWDSIVFSKLKEMIGGRCRFFLSGAAPLNAAMVPWLESAFCVDVVQAYGLTETFAGITSTKKEVEMPDSSIGVVLGYTTLRLADVPEMNYFHTDSPPRGEILVKGGSVFSGYYKDSEATSDVLTSDGWFSTGDIAQLDPNGCSISIIDRKKNIFKLAQGEYIAAEKLENIYSATDGVSQLWVYGEGGDNFIVGVVVPDVEKMPKLLKDLGLPPDTFETPESANCQPLIDHFMKALNATGKQNNLAGFEMLKGV